MHQYYWWNKYQFNERVEYIQTSVYTYNTAAPSFPKELNVLYQNSDERMRSAESATGEPLFKDYEPDFEVSDKILDFYKYQYKDLDDDGSLTQKDLDKWD